MCVCVCVLVTPHFVVEPVQQTRHRDEDGGLQDLDVLDQQLDVPTKEANLPSTHEHHTLVMSYYIIHW